LIEHLQELAINPDGSLGSRWNKITGATHKTAEETLEKHVENNQMTGSTNNAMKPQK
jgi:20S proteasome alpha/beta subunit